MLTLSSPEIKQLANVMDVTFIFLHTSIAPANANAWYETLNKITANINSTLHRRSSAYRIIDYIAEEGTRNIFQYLMDKDQPFSLILNGSADTRNHHYDIVYLEALEGEVTIPFFVFLLQLSQSFTAESYLNTLLPEVNSKCPRFEARFKGSLVAIITDSAKYLKSLCKLVVLFKWSGKRIGFFRELTKEEGLPRVEFKELQAERWILTPLKTSSLHRNCSLGAWENKIAGLLIDESKYFEQLNNEIKTMGKFNSPVFQSFLEGCVCGEKKGCTLDEYEEADSWELLSAVYKLHPSQFPASKEVLDLQYPLYSSPEEFNLRIYALEEINALAGMFGFRVSEVLPDWQKLVSSIVSAPSWITTRQTSDSNLFWANFLLRDDSIVWTGTTRKFIQMLKTVTPGSVACETGFSIFNNIKTKARMRTSDSQVESILKTLISGPKSVNEFDSSY
ncbi:unnamed protein product [Orchesella dallaii]|uniref:HAT C-terminal dimerisation domain-containing protein n=1 Tax=Orchesella dallaii TaxID=48710 RepID=A0ABP1RQ77_9HEXA